MREAWMHRATFLILWRNGDDIDALLRVMPCAQDLQPLVGSEVEPVACLCVPFHEGIDRATRRPHGRRSLPPARRIAGGRAFGLGKTGSDRRVILFVLYAAAHAGIINAARNAGLVAIRRQPQPTVAAGNAGWRK
jgi:hypothetical protein